MTALAVVVVELLGAALILAALAMIWLPLALFVGGAAILFLTNRPTPKGKSP